MLDFENDVYVLDANGDFFEVVGIGIPNASKPFHVTLHLEGMFDEVEGKEVKLHLNILAMSFLECIEQSGFKAFTSSEEDDDFYEIYKCGDCGKIHVVSPDQGEGE